MFLSDGGKSALQQFTVVSY